MGHQQGHGHSHSRHEHDQHEHGRHKHEHEHSHRHGVWFRLRHAVTPHSHDAASKVDQALESSRAGIRAVWWSFLALLATAGLQVVVVALSGSVALLGDTVHNAADALSAVPLAIAFVLGRRAATRGYTYGFGRAEDLAGLIVVVLITLSAGFAAYQAIERLANPRDIDHVGWVAAAAVIGFVGNEAVAQYRIRVGRRIGSAALVADGLHARTDGFTSLSVLASAVGSALGWSLADPIVGLLITVAILAVLRDAGRQVFRRLMDGVEPQLADTADRVVRGTNGVLGVPELRLRWVGHALHLDASVDVAPDLSLAQAHRVAHETEHRLRAELPMLRAALIHAYPSHGGPPVRQ